MIYHPSRRYHRTREETIPSDENRITLKSSVSPGCVINHPPGRYVFRTTLKYHSRGVQPERTIVPKCFGSKYHGERQHDRTGSEPFRAGGLSPRAERRCGPGEASCPNTVPWRVVTASSSSRGTPESRLTLSLVVVRRKYRAASRRTISSSRLRALKSQVVRCSRIYIILLFRGTCRDACRDMP